MFKKSIYVIAASMVIANVQAQSIALSDSSGTLSAGDTISIEISVEDYDISVPVAVQNISGSAKQINVTRYEVDVVSNTSSFFCWGSCAGVTIAGDLPVATPAGYITIASGQTIPGNGSGFAFHYDPNYQAGTSLFKLKFFDINNPSDSSEIFISITSIDYAGDEELSTNQICAYPNPVNGALNIKGEFEEAILYNSLGEQLLTFNEKSVNIEHLSAGVYQLNIDGRTLRVVKN